MNRSALACTATLCLTIAGVTVLNAGPTDPPAGPITGTYKTLAEVEPRSAVNATTCPGDANSIFKITHPGSYYLTGNITGVVGKDGIEIAASGVTLDLNGFTLAGVSGAAIGVRCTAYPGEFTLRNGVVKQWSYGADLTSPGGSGRSVIVENVIFSNNLNAGVYVGEGSTVRDCIATDNAKGGFVSSAGSTTYEHCTALSNGLSGFTASASSFVACTANDNTTGFALGGECSVSACVASSNAAYGVTVSSTCTVRASTFSRNGTAGIQASQNNNTIEGNLCAGNGNGMDIAGEGNSIDSNRINSNTGKGLNVLATNNIITRNTAHANPGGNYSIVAGNSVAPLVGVVGTNNWPAVANSNHPFANFGF